MVERPAWDGRPLIGVTSQGTSGLTYMVTLKPELEKRGFEVAIFHSTGMGGRAFESLAARGEFAAVFDFALPELGNLLSGSAVNAGRERLTAAGDAGVPQLVAPGSINWIDFPASQLIPEQLKERNYHAHNRLLHSVASSPEEQRAVAREIGVRTATAKAPVHVIIPTQGIVDWDRVGNFGHDPAGLTALIDELRQSVLPPADLVEIDAHINDPEFCEVALELFDGWLEDGTVARPDTN